MAKRRAAEPLTFHVPWKRLLLCEFPEEPPPRPLWIPPAAASPLGQPRRGPELPRKRKVDAGAMTEPSASPSKRHDGGDTSAPGGAEREGRSWETSEPPPLQQPPLRPHRPGEELQGARPPRGGGDSGAGRAEPPRGDWGAAPRQVGDGEGWALLGWVGYHFPRHFPPREGTDRPPLDSCHQDDPKGEKPGSLLQERTPSSRQQRGSRSSSWRGLGRVRGAESARMRQGNRAVGRGGCCCGACAGRGEQVRD